MDLAAFWCEARQSTRLSVSGLSKPTRGSDLASHTVLQHLPQQLCSTPSSTTPSTPPLPQQQFHYTCILADTSKCIHNAVGVCSEWWCALLLLLPPLLLLLLVHLIWRKVGPRATRPDIAHQSGSPEMPSKCCNSVTEPTRVLPTRVLAELGIRVGVIQSLVGQ